MVSGPSSPYCSIVISRGQQPSEYGEVDHKPPSCSSSTNYLYRTVLPPMYISTGHMQSLVLSEPVISWDRCRASLSRRTARTCTVRRKWNQALFAFTTNTTRLVIMRSNNGSKEENGQRGSANTTTEMYSSLPSFSLCGRRWFIIFHQPLTKSATDESIE